MTELSEIMTNLDMKADETQTYLPSSSESESSSSSSDASSKRKEKSDSATIQRRKLNEFLCASGKEPVNIAKKDWKHLSTRTKNDRIRKATDVIVASFQVIAPKDPGFLWEALNSSKSVEKALETEVCSCVGRCL